MMTQVGQQHLRQRVADLYANDSQFETARPDDTITAKLERPEMPLIEVIETVMAGYADRPALARRAVEFTKDPSTGRTVACLLPQFQSITYRQLWQRAGAVAVGLSGSATPSVRPGDRVATLGFTSVDYATVDLALIRLGAVAVPLQTSATTAQRRAIIAETEPVVIASSIDYLADAVELLETSRLVTNLVVFDYRAPVDDHRQAVDDARQHLSDVGSPVAVEILDDMIAQGQQLSMSPPLVSRGDDALSLLLYTSGSTGTPKGAMHPERLVANFWRESGRRGFDQDSAVPSITLNYLPLSHGMGRGLLHGTLSTGGIAYFVASNDLSTFLEDFALVRPTQVSLVPRVLDLLHADFQRELNQRSGEDGDLEALKAHVMAERRHTVLGGRVLSALTGSAPVSDEMRAFARSYLGVEPVDGYGSTEAGAFMTGGQLRRPPVIDCKLVDVPELSYFGTDQPYPRGELLIKTQDMFAGYYKRPQMTAEAFDDDGYYRTGDIVAELGPDHLKCIDRRNNVLKLSQGEFVTIARLEEAFNSSPLVRQIYLYGNSSRPYLLAVVVPSDEVAVGGHDVASVKTAISASLRQEAQAAGLQPYEIPRDLVIETEPFTEQNGLLTGTMKLARPKLKERYGELLEALYTNLAEAQAEELRTLRQSATEVPIIETVARAAGSLLGTADVDLTPDAQFTGLGGDSLSALTFANLLREAFDVEVPVGVIVSPATDLQAIADYIEGQQHEGTRRLTLASVHGPNATEVHARDLTLDRFIDAETLIAAPSLPNPSSVVRAVLLTGATGFLGRYLALEWLNRMHSAGGKLICLVRAKNDVEARKRLDNTFEKSDPHTVSLYRKLAADHLEVISGDKGEHRLGLDSYTWQRLADTVDLIIDPAAMVNHVLPYDQLFQPNVVGTAELIRIALTSRRKPLMYVSTVGVGTEMRPGTFVEDADIRVAGPTRRVDDGYANGYSNSKWAGEVLLREAHDLCGLPVSVFRCDMIMAEPSITGQLNLSCLFSRLMLSLVATGIAPESFYELDANGNRQRAHFDGLPVNFIAEAMTTLGLRHSEGFHTLHVMNPHDDGIGLDEYVDWLNEAGYPVRRVGDYQTWLHRFQDALRALPEQQRHASLLPLIHNYRLPEKPVCGPLAPADRFRAEIQQAKITPTQDIPHVGPDIITKYITDLQLLGLL